MAATDPGRPDRCPRCGSTARLGAAGGACAACAIASALEPASTWVPSEPGGGPGWWFGGYEILGELARGGMGVVYRARQVQLGREVALKMIRAGQLAREEDIHRFRTEAMAAARLRHPGIVAIHEIGEEGGQHYFSMDLIEGPNLAERVAGRPMEAEPAARLMAGIGRAVQFAHEHGVLHRDLKPSNVLLGPGDVPHVTDFGLARLVDGTEQGTEGGETVSGTILGSPAYMPPEQAQGRTSEVTVRSDVYALGAILYELLTGRPPFRGGSPLDILRQVVERDPVAPGTVVQGVPADLETVCLRCLSKLPADRYGSALEVVEELERFQRGEPILARPVSGLERWVRWCRREPLLAGALAAVLVLLGSVAGVAVVAAWRIDRARVRAEAESGRATRAEGEAREQLRVALLAQARASRFTGRVGQRTDALRAAVGAAQVRSGPDVRDEVAAALALPDLGPAGSGPEPEPADRLAFDPARQRYLVESPGGGLVLRGLPEGRELVRFETAGARVRGFPVFDPAGGRVAARMSDDTLRVWRVVDGGMAWSLPGRPYPDQPRTTRFGEDLVFDPAGRWFAVGHPAGGVTFHDADTGVERVRWRSGWVPRRAAASADGRWLAVADFTDDAPSAAVVVVVETGQGTEVGRIEGMSGVRGLAWMPDGSGLAVARAGRVELLRWPGGELHRRLETPDGPAMDLAFDPGGEWLLTHSSRSVFRWWNVREGRVALELTRPVALSARIAVSPDFGRVHLASTAESQTPSVQALTFEPSPVYRVILPPAAASSQQVASSIGTLDFSPDGGWISVACLDEVQVRERATGGLVVRLVRDGRSDWSTARFGADRTTLYVSSRARGLLRYRLSQGLDGAWSADAGELVDGEADFMLCSIHRPSGRLALASARVRRAFKLLSPEGGTPPAVWPSVQAYEVAFSPEGSRVVANSVPVSDETGARRIEVRDAVTGALERTLDAGIGATARWSADGRWLLTASLPDRVDLWRAADWTRGPALAREVQAPNGTFALSPDGSLLAAFNEVETFLLSTATGEVLMRLTEPPGTLGYVTDMAFSPDGRVLALLRRNAVLALWDVGRLRTEMRERGVGW
jgi:WD40 repeat protein